MNTTFYHNAEEFLSVAGRLLDSNEARYGLISEIALRLIVNPHYYGKEGPWFFTISDNSGVHAAAIRTPPQRVLIAQFSGETETVSEALVDAISERHEPLPGSTGDLEITRQFAAQWCIQHGTRITDTQAQRIYRLDHVNNIDRSPGHLRLVSVSEKDVLNTWQRAANVDIFGPNQRNYESDITPAIERKDIFIWEDLMPVSMAGKTRQTDRGCSVSRVYTPPEFRNRGYATSCVAALSQKLLDDGYKFCTLYTDLANPTSNSIYKRIGYKEVGESVQYRFSGPTHSGGR